MADTLGKKALSGAGWKFAERILAQGVTTIVGIVLARLLSPEHYGIIAIVNIFITICNVFVVTGLAESLIQKKDADELDFSSIFFVNIGIALILYLVLFIAAPFITAFYGSGYEALTGIIQVMGLRLILAAINSIQHAKVAREFAFRKYFFVTMFGTIISGFVGITLAYYGFGVWALVGQYMTNSTIDTIMLFVFVRWVPKLQFSIKRTKHLVTYGLRMLSTSLLITLANELEQLLIGKIYSPADLAFYSKGNTYPKLAANNLSIAISSTMFPLLSKVQGDREASKKYVSWSIQLISFIVFPMMTGMMLVANDFVRILLTEKWLPCVPYLRLSCAFYMVSSLTISNSQLLTANGAVKLYSRLTCAIRLLGLFMLFITARFGVVWIAISKVFVSLAEYIIKCFPTQKRLGYGLLQQMKDVFPNIVGCVMMATVVIEIQRIGISLNPILSFGIQIVMGAISYIWVAFIMKNAMLTYIIGMLKSKLK